MKSKDIFAVDKKNQGKAFESASHARLESERYSRLMENDDFKEFFFMLMVELCGFGDDLTSVDEWHQGLRAASAFLRRKMIVAEGAVDFFAEIDKRYFNGVRKGILEAYRKNTENERQRP